MRLPIGAGKYTTPPAHWERWLARLHGSFADRLQTTGFDRKILLHLVCLYHAFSIGHSIATNADFYDVFTMGLIDIACRATGRCVKRELVLYVVDMSVLMPDVSPNVSPVVLPFPLMLCVISSRFWMMTQSLRSSPMTMPNLPSYQRHCPPRSAQLRTSLTAVCTTPAMSLMTPCHRSSRSRTHLTRTVTILIAQRTLRRTRRRTLSSLRGLSLMRKFLILMSR